MNVEDWNERYAGSELLWSAEPNRFLVEEVDGLAPGRALDLAAGEGRNALWLAERGWQVDALDFSNVALERGRRIAEARGVEVRWVEADLENYELPTRAYDLVAVFYLHLPWPRMRRILKRSVAAVAARGTWLLVGHDRTNLDRGHGGPKSPDVLYTPEQIAAELPGLRVDEAARRDRTVDTDTGAAVAIDCLVRATRAES
jgi:SAM-dependent methyltransferase